MCCSYVHAAEDCMKWERWTSCLKSSFFLWMCVFYIKLTSYLCVRVPWRGAHIPLCPGRTSGLLFRSEVSRSTFLWRMGRTWDKQKTKKTETGRTNERRAEYKTKPADKERLITRTGERLMEVVVSHWPGCWRPVGDSETFSCGVWAFVTKQMIGFNLFKILYTNYDMTQILNAVIESQNMNLNSLSSSSHQGQNLSENADDHFFIYSTIIFSLDEKRSNIFDFVQIFWTQ